MSPSLSLPPDNKEPWSATDNRDSTQAIEARKSLTIWPLDESNTILLNEVAPRNYTNPTQPNDITTSSRLAPVPEASSVPSKVLEGVLRVP